MKKIYYLIKLLITSLIFIVSAIFIIKRDKYVHT